MGVYSVMDDYYLCQLLGAKALPIDHPKTTCSTSNTVTTSACVTSQPEVICSPRPLTLVLNKSSEAEVTCSTRSLRLIPNKSSQAEITCSPRPLKLVPNNSVTTQCASSRSDVTGAIKPSTPSRYEPAQYQCRLCPSTFKREHSLIDHIKGIHQNNRYRCIICDKEFTTRSGLKGHISEHQEDFKFMCSECGKGFVYKSKLDRHLLKHRPDPLKCPKCPKTCNGPQGLKKHLMICGVTAAPEMCNVCGKRFKCLRYLKVHQSEQHLKNRELITCPFCGLPYKCSRSLSAHVKKKHGDTTRNTSDDMV